MCGYLKRFFLCIRAQECLAFICDFAYVCESSYNGDMCNVLRVCVFVERCGFQLYVFTYRVTKALAFLLCQTL